MGKFRIQVFLGEMLSSCYTSIRFLYHRFLEKVRYGKYEFIYCNELNNKRSYVLANGPSLNEELPLLENDVNFIQSPKFVLNYFAETSYYTQLRPEFYCIADPLFFAENATERNRKIIRIINEQTNWRLKLYIPNKGLKKVQPVITSPYIEIIPISTLRYEGFECKKYLSYKKGISVPSFVNVTIMIEYILLNMGCKDIRLYGVDHTFFEGMTVDDNNIPCMVDKHFYGEKKIHIFNSHGGYWTMSGWLYDKYLTFKEHENMRSYADYLGARIVNCTKGSLIDAYVRLAQLEKENKQDKA